MDHKKKRRSVVIAALVLCLAAVTGLGTLAWLTAQDTASNEFTVGNFNDPGYQPDPDQPVNPEPDNPVDEEDPFLNGLLTETEWVSGSKVTPSYDIAKNPNVGVGADSDDSYVFVYVKNSMTTDPDDASSNAPYFTLGTNWAAVEGTTTAGAESGSYVSGLFVYTGGGAAGSPFVSNKTADKESWPVEDEDGNKIGDKYTGELFDKVHVPADADLDKYADTPTMEVTAYLYAVQYGADSQPVPSGEGSLTNAIAWAKQQAGIGA